MSSGEVYCSLLPTLRLPLSPQVGDTVEFPIKMGSQPGQTLQKYQFPLGYHRPYLSSYILRSPVNPHGAARSIRYEFLRCRHCERMRSPYTSRNTIVNPGSIFVVTIGRVRLLNIVCSKIPLLFSITFFFSPLTSVSNCFRISCGIAFCNICVLMSLIHNIWRH